MSLISCVDGNWQQDSLTGAISCSGTLEVVAGGGPFGLPPITYEEADAMLLSTILLFAAVWGVRQLRRIIR